MKFLVFLALVYSASGDSMHLEDCEREFNKFQTKYNRNYDTAAKKESCLHCFSENYKTIISHNLEADKGLHSYRLGINRYADMNDKEFSQKFNGYKPELKRKQNPNIYNKTSNCHKTVDWRTQGYVTPIKDQGKCGSCWAFSAVASMEGQLFKNTKNLVPLSEQNLVDCSAAQGNKGCNGGLMSKAFDYVIKNRGIDIEKSYPYNASVGTCRFHSQYISVTIDNYIKVKSGDENALKHAVCHIGPICVAIDSSPRTFHMYSSGVYDEPKCHNKMSKLNHAVTVVGYGTDSITGKDYWLAKNQWGKSWGEKGYIRMSRNKDNQCGIATMASFPTGVNIKITY